MSGTNGQARNGGAHAAARDGILWRLQSLLRRREAEIVFDPNTESVGIVVRR